MAKMNYEKLKELRISRKISLQEMADAIGLKTAGGYLRIETGENKLDVNHLPIIADKFGMTLKEFIEEIFFNHKVAKNSTSKSEVHINERWCDKWQRNGQPGSR